MQAQMAAYDTPRRMVIEDRRRVNIVTACAIAGVSRRTIYRWLERGTLEAVRTPGGQLRIYADTLLLPDRRYT